MRFVVFFCFCSMPCLAQNIDIPDANFKSFLVGSYDSNGDGEISQAEAAAVSGTLNCSSQEIADLTGISFFIGLTQLDCYNNELTELPDLSSLTNLTILLCYSNQLTTLPDLNALTNLTHLYCYSNQLTALPDLNALTSLTNLHCQGNQLTALPDLSVLTSLTYLSCHTNQLTALPDLSVLTSLASLLCYTNQLTTLPDLNALTSLTRLYCHSNQLTALPNLSGLNSLTTAKFEGNHFTEDDCPDILRTLNMGIPTFTYNPQSDESTLDCPCVAPSISAQTASTTYCQGSVAQLTVTAEGTAPFFYQWFKDSAEITDATNASFEISALTLGDAGNYHCEVSSYCGSVTGSVIAIAVASPLTISSQPSPVVVAEGAPASFTVTASGSPVSHQWFKDGTSIDGATTATYTLSAVTAADEGDYSCSLLNTCGTVDSQAANLSMNINIPDANFKSFLVASYDSNGDGEIGLAEAAAVTGMYCPDMEIADLTGLSYFIGLTSLYCYSNQLTALPDLSVLTSLTHLHCTNNQLTTLPGLSSLTNLIYLYCSNNPLTALPDLSSLTSLISLYCSSNQLTALPDLSSLSSLADLYCNSNQLTALPDLSSLTNLRQLECQNNQLTEFPNLSGLNSLATAKFEGNNFTEDDCPDILRTINMGIPTFTYNPQSDGTTLDCPCVAPSISSQTASATYCQGSVAQLTVTSEGTAPFFYQWFKDSAEITDATNASFEISALTLGDAGNYHCEVSSYCGSVTGGVIAIAVASPLTISSQPSPVVVAEGAPASFTVTASGSPDSYQWYKDGTSIDGATAATFSLSAVSAADVGDYSCSLGNSCGSVETQAANLSMNINIPDANFKSFLVSRYDSNGDGEISQAEAAAVTGSMSCGSQGIADLTGISFFTGVRYLLCGSNQLTALPDLSSLTWLRRLGCNKNQLTALPDLSSLSRLTYLGCEFNQLTALPDLSTSVTSLYCKSNQLTTLPDLSSLTSLTRLECQDNQLTALPDLSSLSSLSHLSCFSNQLTALPDLSSLTSLTVLYCHFNQLSVLPDLSVLTSLTHLYCHSNQLTTLPDLSSLTSLTHLSCSTNLLTALPALSSLSSLKSLNCSSNQLTALPDFSSLTSLTALVCNSNQLTTLPDLSSFTSLTYLTCNSNQLTEFPDLSGLNSLTTAKFEGNNFSEDDCPDILRTLNMGISGFTYNPQSDDSSLNCPCVAPTISAQTTSTTFCQGNAAQLTVTAEGTAPFFYQWFKDSAEISGATNVSLDFSSISLDDSGNYHCEVSSYCGSVTGGEIAIAVATPLTITNQPSTVAVAEGAPASFTVTASGSPDSYQWNKDGTPINGATTATYTLSAVTAADEGDYSCTMQKNSCGTVESQTANLSLAVHIPDTNFKSYLIATYDSNGDGEISDAEAAAVSGTLNCSGQGITNLTGISSFTGLTELLCHNNLLPTLPELSALTNLTILDCQSNLLTALPDLSSLTNLTKIDCIRNQLTSLPSLSALPSLTHLYAYSNLLTTVPDLSGLNNMLQARIYRNPFTFENCPEILSIIEDGPVIFMYNPQSDGSNLDCNCEPPEISTHPSDAFAAVGESVTFTTAASGTDIDYQWSKDGVPLTNATAASYTLNEVTTADQGNYSCLVENDCGNAVSDAAMLSFMSLELPLEVSGSRNALLEFPLLVRAGSGFTIFDFIVAYDSQKLQFNDVVTADTLSSGWLVLANPLGPDRLQVVGVNAQALEQDGTLLRLRFTVDSGVSSGECSDLLLEHATFNGSPTITQDGAFCACLKGDADENGDVELTDAMLVLQVIDNIPTPFDPIGPSCIDVDCDGQVLAQDAGLILQFAVGQIQEFCPASLLPKPTTVVQIEMADLCLEGGQRFSLDINASRLFPEDRVFGYQFSLAYDEELLSFDGFETVGSLSQDWMTEANDSHPGSFSLSAIHSAPLAGEGLLIRLHGLAWQGDGVSELKWDQFLLGDGSPAAVTPSAKAFIAWNEPSEDEVLSILCPRDGMSRPSAAKRFGSSCESQEVKLLNRPALGTVTLQTNHFIYSAGSALGVDAFSFRFSNAGELFLERNATVRILDAAYFDALASWPDSSLLGLIEAIDFPESSEIEGIFDP